MENYMRIKFQVRFGYRDFGIVKSIEKGVQKWLTEKKINLYNVLILIPQGHTPQIQVGHAIACAL